MDHYFILAGCCWLILQIAALWTMQGWWRKAAWLSAATMVLAFAVAMLGILADSNLAPIWVVFAIPVCLLWTLLLWIARSIAWAIKR